MGRGEGPKKSKEELAASRAANLRSHRITGAEVRWFTKEETAEQMAHARRALTLPNGTQLTVAAELRRTFGIGKKRAKRLVDRVLAEWSEGVDPRQATKNRAQASTRIRRALQRATHKLVKDPSDPAGRRSSWVEREDPDLRSVFQLESLLMRVEGYEQAVPVNLSVQMNAAGVAAISELTVEQVAGMLARREESMRLAQLARARLPEAIDTIGEEVLEPGKKKDRS
jgi:ribosomal protein L7/L12